MKQETIFLHDQVPSKLGLNLDKVRQLKQELKFQPKSEYYLRIPQQTYLPMLLFCLTATNNSLTKKIKNTLNNLQQGFQKQIEELYLNKNQKRVEFIGPQQLELFSNTVNYNQKMFKKCHANFKENEIIHALDLFKDKFKVIIFSHHSQKHAGADKKIENPQEVIYLLKENNSMFLCSYSSKPKPKPAKVEERSSSKLIAENQNLKVEIQIGKKKQSTELIQRKQQVDKGDQQQESKLHYSYTTILVLILIVLIYFAFAEIDPSFFSGTHNRFQKSILEHLIQSIDSITSLIFATK